MDEVHDRFLLAAVGGEGSGPSSKRPLVFCCAHPPHRFGSFAVYVSIVV